MRQVATTKDWYAEKERNQIYAGDHPVELPNVACHSPGWSPGSFSSVTTSSRSAYRHSRL